MAIFWAVSPHFQSHNDEIWREVVELGLFSPSPTPNFVKFAYGDIPLWGNLYQNFEIFATLSYFSPHFIPMMLKFERNLENITNPSTTQNVIKSLKGYCTGPAGIALPRGGDAY